MARGANLRLSGSVLGQLANPSFAGPAGMSIGLGMLGSQRRKEEAETRVTEETTLDLLRKAQVAEEQGDMRLHNEITTTLDGMLTGNTNESSRDLITRGLATVSGQRAATQKASQTSTAMSIIKTEEALETMNNSTAPMTNEEYMQRAKVQGALEDRLRLMKQNGPAVIEANEISFQAELKAATNSNELAEQKKGVAKRALSSFAFGSADYNAQAQSIRDQGLGQVVDQYETTQYALVESKEAADKIRRSTAPLTEAETQLLKDNSFNPTGDIRRDRDRLALISETLDKRTIMQANANTARVASAGILATVETVLNRQAKRGDLTLNFRDDLYNKIEQMSDEDKLRLADSLKRPSGEELTADQIEQEVISFLKTEFPEQFKGMETRQENLKVEQEEIEILTADLMAQAAEKDPALQGIITRGKDGTVSGIENVPEAVYRKYRMEAEGRRGPITSFIRSMSQENNSPEAQARRNAAEQNIVSNMGRAF